MEANILDQIPMLSPDKRQEAREQAHELVRRRAGPRPDRKDYQNRRISPYPTWITATSLTLLALLFLVTFVPSTFRLFTAGRDTFERGIPNEPVQAAAVGIAIFAMAEITVILATIVQRVWYPDKSQHILNAAIILGVLIALFGNIAVAQPRSDELTFWTVFEWLEAVGPSVIVFVTSSILKQIMFRSLEHRTRNEQEYQEALQAWEDKVSDPESDPKFMPIYGSSIKDAITRSFVVGAKASDRRELLNSLSNHDWLQLFIRELQQENWVPTNIVIEQPDVVIEAANRLEVGSNESPLSPQPQPAYGFKTGHSND